MSDAPGTNSGVVDWAAWISAGAAWCALIFSFLNSRTARKALELARQQEQRQSRSLHLHLLEATSTRIPATSERVLTCRIRATNGADAPNSIVSIDLHITYELPGGVVTVVKVPFEPAPAAQERLDEQLTVPARLDARAAVAGCVDFRIRSGLTSGRRIDRYELVVTDAYSETELVEINVFKEISDG